MKIMVKIGFNCQLPISEIGLTTYYEGTRVTSLFYSRVLMRFHAPLRTQKNGEIPFLRNTYKIRHYKNDNGNPTINYFIYEFHSNRNTCPTETEFETCYPFS
ncbi:hypothetical protein FXO38_32750 [Capsicum annuum]|uniref:Uncharacterized protein n=1 Tax=Capsicum annuum TaxID=4072 RepID=A0A2G2Y1T5_CAPAN|nr:hypothetical protein FXO38_32750 [Capsicum annuum]PHT63702.1 hypothetical protein T459_32388 [Capsicum annuum]